MMKKLVSDEMWRYVVNILLTILIGMSGIIWASIPSQAELEKNFVRKDDIGMYIKNDNPYIQDCKSIETRLDQLEKQVSETNRLMLELLKENNNQKNK